MRHTLNLAIIDFICYSKAKFPKRMDYKPLPDGEIYALIKFGKNKK